ncbi:MAG: DNA repair protein RadC [Mycoplasmataceae bacterium]|nr:DNA repair protein RadC [Mycoplasmataceae bacterium]
MPIRDIPLEQRPREKASLFGFESLSDIELLAIFIRTGGKESVLSVSYNLISKFGSLNMLSNSSIKELMKVKGIGKVKAIEIKALEEFSKRISNNFNIKTKIKTIDDVVLNSLKHFGDFRQEHFVILSLDRLNNVISWKQLYKGTTSSVLIEPREIVSLLIKEEAEKFFCLHNHPSGNVNPSRADIMLTKRIENHVNLFNIELSGHIIINSEGDFQKIDIE